MEDAQEPHEQYIRGSKPTFLDGLCIECIHDVILALITHSQKEKAEDCMGIGTIKFKKKKFDVNVLKIHLDIIFLKSLA